jgi:hypothetical protein
MRYVGYKTLIGGAAIALAGFTPLGAQVREGARTSLDEAKIAFGYVCDDRFIVTNDGTEPVRLEYGLDRSDARTTLSLDGRESVELLLSSQEQLNLMMEGRVIATAYNERRRCEDDDPPRVVVRRPVVSIEPTIVLVRSPSYYRYYDSGWWRHDHHRRTSVHTTIRIPIILGRTSRDRGRDYDRGRDNRGRDNRSRDNDRDRDRDRGRRGR